MVQRAGYWVDLAQVQLSDSNGTPMSEIQAMPFGEYDHPVYGKIKFTEDRLKRFADSVNNRVREVDPDIDFEHKQFTGEAAGWVRSAAVTENGLKLSVAWTEKGAQAIKNREFRYFSPEFADEWTNPKTGQKFEDVLFGGGLTNRPFLKDLMPVNLSEIFANTDPTNPTDPTTSKEGEDKVDWKKLRAMLGLSETATEEDVYSKFGEILGGIQKLTTPPTPPVTDPPKDTPDEPPTDPTAGKTVEQVLAELSDLQANPGVNLLTDLVKTQQKELAAFQRAALELKVERKLDELDRMAAEKKFAVPPVVKDQLRQVMLNSGEEMGNKVFSAYMETLKLGLIDLSERGWQRHTGDASPNDMLQKAIAQKLQENPTLSYGDAATLVTAENPQLYTSYRAELTAGE